MNSGAKMSRNYSSHMFFVAHNDHTTRYLFFVMYLWLKNLDGYADALYIDGIIDELTYIPTSIEL